MPRKQKPMQDMQVRNLKAKPDQTRPVCYAEGEVTGLYIQVAASGSKSWIYRYSVKKSDAPDAPKGWRNQVRREIGLGGYPTVTLKEAREKARTISENIKRGVDPLAERTAAKRALLAAQIQNVTFKDVAEQYLEKMSAEWSTKHYERWSRTIKRLAYPSLGNLAINEIDTPHVLQTLQKTWTKNTVQTKALQRHIEKIFALAKTSKYRIGDNPAIWEGHLDTMLPRPSKIHKEESHPSLPYAEIPRFMAILMTQESTGARALQLLILSGIRYNEAAGARWDEFDLDKKIWTIPAERMKGVKDKKREHEVALSDAAIQLVEELSKNKQDPVYLFPGMKGGFISNGTMKAVIKRMHEADQKNGGPGFVDPKVKNRMATPHGYRATFKTWAAEVMHYDDDISEAALAHTDRNKVRAAYRRTNFFEKRQALMNDWASYCLESQRPA